MNPQGEIYKIVGATTDTPELVEILSGTNSPGFNDAAAYAAAKGPPAILLIKDGTLDLGGDGANPGDLINYTFEVTNIGDVILTDVLVSDPIVSPITCPSGNPIPLMAPGDFEICTGSYAITQADIDAGQRDNVATATGLDPNGDPVSDDDDHTEPIAVIPTVEIPTLSQWSLAGFAMLLLSLGVFTLWRRVRLGSGR